MLRAIMNVARVHTALHAAPHHPAQFVSLREFSSGPLHSPCLINPMASSPWALRRRLAHTAVAQAPSDRAPATVAATSTPGPALQPGAGKRVGQLFQRNPVLLLERSVGERVAADAELWGTGCFQGEVYPDLPIATTWRDLVQKLFNSKGAAQLLQVQPAQEDLQQQQQQQQQQEQEQGATGEGEGRPWLVCTVAAQCRSRDQLRAFMLSAAGVDFMGDGKARVRGADALLFVSGSHPARSLPVAGRWLQTSFDLLQMASTMREQGYLPPSVSLWAVENPMQAPVSRLQRKMEAGAEVILTQPPLVWGRAERWVQEADVARLTEQVKLVVGIPMVSSAGNLDFWLRLCGARGLPEAEELLSAFPRQGDLGKPAFEAAVKQWNADFIQRVLDLPGVAGLHVMPLTKAARKMTAELLAEGVLPSSACAGAAGGLGGAGQ